MIVAAPTRLEARAAGRALGGAATVVRVGVGGDAIPGAGRSPVLLVGLCGALVPMPPGTVVIPDEVATSGGPALRCDEAMVAGLRTAAARRGWDPVGGRQLTAPRIVRGAERARWAEAGFATADMEAALLFARYGPGAAVRVVLDSPDHELSADFALPGVLSPTRWPELLRLGRIAPRYARKAAEVVAEWLKEIGPDVDFPASRST